MKRTEAGAEAGAAGRREPREWRSWQAVIDARISVSPVDAPYEQSLVAHRSTSGTQWTVMNESDFRLCLGRIGTLGTTRRPLASGLAHLGLRDSDIGVALQ